MAKFGRNYELSIQDRNKRVIKIPPPFTIEFDITRNLLASSNVSSIRLYNLSENTRSLLRKDAWELDTFRILELKAGYGENLSTMFKGNVSTAKSMREGVDYITTVECFDGGFALANSEVNQSFPKGTPQATVLRSVVKTLKGVEIGKIGRFDGNISRGNTYSGGVAGIIGDLSGGAFYIDNGKANLLGDSECFRGDLNVIDSSSGIIGTPHYENTYVSFDMIMEPRLLVGQKVSVKSIFNEAFNMDYKVISIKHRGMISQSVAGSAITSVGLFAPKGLVLVK